MPERQVTTARDMAILARALLTEFARYRSYYNIPAIQFGGTVMRNYNSLVGRYPGTTGLKTGFICSSGFNLVASARRGGKEAVAVVFGSYSGQDRAERAAALLEAGFRSGGLFGRARTNLANVASGAGFLIVATTRPETLLGDAAVAVHPGDTRYQAYVGQQVLLPLTGRRIPVIADDTVDPAFGSGCVKITPAHDFNDYQIGLRHGLEPRVIFTLDARVNDNAPAAYRGLDRFEAREKVLADLRDQGLIAKETRHRLRVPRCGRTGAVVEPMLTDQWFVKMDALARDARDAVARGDIRFVPENWTATYNDWLARIQDWCISRQLWWGHRIPAWYDDAGKFYVGRDEQGRMVAATVFLTEFTIHGPVRVAVALGPDGKVKGATVVELTEETVDPNTEDLSLNWDPDLPGKPPFMLILFTNCMSLFSCIHSWNNC